ncbi:hypothetical protein F4777DRAFT_573503 [Nemania sp. FL0916]|nr:hypothetical protein F4777DRAFT_573503 [Nemania sp. FL0916]
MTRYEGKHHCPTCDRAPTDQCVRQDHVRWCDKCKRYWAIVPGRRGCPRCKRAREQQELRKAKEAEAEAKKASKKEKKEKKEKKDKKKNKA